MLRAVLLASVLWSSAAFSAEPVGEKHIYKKVGGRELALYITKPDNWKAGDSRPAIVFFHGGGWVGGQPGQFTEHSKHFAKRGLVCVQVQYRLLNRKKAEPPTKCVHDARSAVRWVRFHAKKFGIDPKRIASGGGSAGGHLAAFVGTVDDSNEALNDPMDAKRFENTSSKTSAMLLFNPVFNNGPEGWGHKRVGKRYKEFSPAHNLSKDDPPAIVFVGSKDKLLPVATVRDFQKRLRTHNIVCEVMIFEGEGHGFFNYGRRGNKAYKATIAACEKFFGKLGWLK